MSAKQAINRNVQTVVLAIVGAVLLVLANSALWVNRYIFDTNNFTQVATVSLTSESSRNAIASGIVGRVFENRPLIKNIVDDPATRVISGLLGTTQFSNSLNAVVSRLQIVVTSNNQESVVVNLEGVKNTVTKLITVVDSSATGENINAVPDQITVVDKENIPDFYKYGVAFLWLGPIALIGAVVSLGYPYFKNTKRQFKHIMLVQGLALTVASLLATMVGPLFKPPLLANIDQASTRVVTSNLYDAFINTFVRQTTWLLSVGVLVVFIAIALYLAPKLLPSKTRR